MAWHPTCILRSQIKYWLPGVAGTQPRLCSGFGGSVDEGGLHRPPFFIFVCPISTCRKRFWFPKQDWLNVIRSVSMGPSAIHESGHFYFAQTGHSHFAAIP